MQNSETTNKTESNEKDTSQDLVSMSAHQLRTSLSAVKWILKMLIDKDAGPLTLEQENLLGKAYESNERMISLVGDMLNISKLEDIENSYHFEKQDISPLVESVLFEFMSETKKRGIELIFLKATSSLPEVSIDGNKMRIVLENLIENAIKYSDDDDKIFVSISTYEDNLIVSVKDNGIGIPDEVQGKIFTKFYRAPNAASKISVGSGLGLFSAKKIVERHSGKIWFENSPHGVTFYFTIPTE